MPRPWSARIAVRLRRLGRVAVRDAALGRDPAHDRLVAVGLVDRHRRPAGSRPCARCPCRCRRSASGSGVSVPSACSSNSMKTRFQNSRKRSQRVQPGSQSGCAAAVLLAPVPVHLRVGPARARGRRPTRSSPTRAARTIRSARLADLAPVLVRDLVLAEPELGVAGEDGDPEPLGVELQVLEHELPGELDRALLEVLAEREVAEHLEERQVRAVEADLVDVRRAEALLHGRQQRRRRLLAAEEERHQRLHPGGREQRRAVVGARDRAAPTAGTRGPSTRRRRGSPRAARLTSASRDCRGRPRKASRRRRSSRSRRTRSGSSSGGSSRSGASLSAAACIGTQRAVVECHPAVRVPALDSREVAFESSRPVSLRKSESSMSGTSPARSVSSRRCRVEFVTATSLPPGRSTRASSPSAAVELGHVVEHPGRDGDVELAVGEREILHVADASADSLGSLDLHHPLGLVDADELGAQLLHDALGQLALAAADLEHPSRARRGNRREQKRTRIGPFSLVVRGLPRREVGLGRVLIAHVSRVVEARRFRHRSRSVRSAA